MGISLNVDGTVTGAETGSWICDGKNITLNLGGYVYKGVLHRQKNESGKIVLTFTAAGKNNCCVWGVKNESAALPEPILTAALDGDLEGAVTVARPGNGSEINPVEISKSVTYEEGVNGKALRMDGSYGLKLPDVGTLKSYAVSLWIRPDSLSQFGPIVAASPDFVSGVWLNMTTVEDDHKSRIWSRRQDLDIWPWEDKADVFTLGRWQHMIISVDGDRNGLGSNSIRGSLYIDGERVSQGDVAVGILENGGAVYIGANAWDPYFDGLVSDVRVYDKSLTMAEAREVYEDSLPLSLETGGSGGSVSVRIKGRLPLGAKLGAASYTDGGLTALDIADVTGRDYEFKLPSGGAEKVKVFLWSDIPGMEPLTPAKIWPDN